MQDTDRLRELADRLNGTMPVTYDMPILNERSKTHGSFDDNARLSQRFRAFMRAEAGWDKLTDTQKESLDMIAHKIGRILAGNASFQDHWTDIAGYAKLSEARCNGPTE